MIQEYTIPIEIRKNSAAYRLTLSYRPGQHIRITMPYQTNDTILQPLIKSREKRILKHYLSQSDSLIFSNPDLCDHSREHFLIHKQSALEFCTRKVQQRNQKL